MITTIGVFATHTGAEKIIQALRNVNIDEKDLSYLYANEEGYVQDGQSGDKVSSASVTGVATGAVIGGIAGLVIANGLIPGFGSLVIAGPLAETLGITAATTLVAASTGAVAGGLIGGLTHLGVSKDDVHLYEEHVRHGGVLIIARTETMSTKDIFKEHDGKDVQEYRLS